MDHLSESTGRGSNLAMAGQDPIREGTPVFNAARDLGKLPIQIRPAGDEDIAMLYDSWLKSYAGQNKDQPRWSVYPMQRIIVRRLLRDAITLVAAGNDVESKDDIYGWACAERSPKYGRLVLHYAFTKMIFRKRGIFRALLGGFDHDRGESIYCSHRGFILKEIKNRYNTRYVPQLQFDWGMDQFERAYGAVAPKGKK